MNKFHGILCDKSKKTDVKIITQLLFKYLKEDPEKSQIAEGEVCLHWLGVDYANAYFFKDDKTIVGFCIVKLLENRKILNLVRILTFPKIGVMGELQ